MNSPQILVAVDISEGKVVRLTHGEMAKKTIYGNDPVAAAQDWESQGAEWLHVVDLDAAMGAGNNIEVIGRVIKSVSIPVEVGGGLRSFGVIEWLIDAGAARVVVGTRAHEPIFLDAVLEGLGDRLIVSIDSKNGVVKSQGWTSSAGLTAMEAVEAMERAGVPRIIFTDVSRDGTLEGADVPLIEKIVKAARVPVIAGGGVATGDDIRGLARLAEAGLEGIIIGKALYSGSLTLDAAKLAAADQDN